MSQNNTRDAHFTGYTDINPLELERQGDIAELAERPILFTSRLYEIRWVAVS
jgi:hypothetical protein